MVVGARSASARVFPLSVATGSVSSSSVMRSVRAFRTSEYPLEWMPELGSPRIASPSRTLAGPSIFALSTTPTQKPARS